MKTTLLLGATVLALSALGISGAWANPQNVFSDDSRNSVNSSASVGGIVMLGANDCHNEKCGGSKDPSHTANSEAFNVNQNAVSYQEMCASSNGSTNVAVSVFEDASVSTGDASIGGGGRNAGVTSLSANTGNGSAAQQGISLAALGTVNVGH